MKKLFIILFLCVTSQICLANNDSIRVSICLDTNTIDCFGFDKYTREVTHFNQAGLLIEENSFRFSKCQSSPPDTMVVRTQDVYYAYDSLQHLITRDFLNYEYGNQESRDTNAYDTSGNLISVLTYEGSPGSLSNTQQIFWNYDSLNRKILELHLNWNSISSIWDSTRIFYWYFSSNTELSVTRGWNTQTQTMDSIDYNLQVFDSLGRLIFTETRNFNQISEWTEQIVYNSNSEIISETFSNTYNNNTDSTRYLYTYTGSGKKLETWDQTFDTAQVQWASTKRQYFIYNGIDSLSVHYVFNCPDTTCTDTADMQTYVYDGSNRLVKIVDSLYDYNSQSWHVYFPITNTYDQLGRRIESTNSAPPDHCSYGELNEYVYNSSDQVIFHYNIHQTCDQWMSGCWFYNLTGDSMLVNLFYPFAHCQGDTVYPATTVLGGTQPYTIQWTPANLVLNPDIDSATLIADSGMVYMLQVTDSNGFTQSDSLTIRVVCGMTTEVEQIDANHLSVFPNPFSDFTRVTFGAKISGAELFDLSGRKLKQYSTAENELLIMRNEMESGIYLLKVHYKNGDSKILKLIISS